MIKAKKFIASTLATLFCFSTLASPILAKDETESEPAPVYFSIDIEAVRKLLKEVKDLNNKIDQSNKENSSIRSEIETTKANLTKLVNDSNIELTTAVKDIKKLNGELNDSQQSLTELLEDVQNDIPTNPNWFVRCIGYILDKTATFTAALLALCAYSCVAQNIDTWLNVKPKKGVIRSLLGSAFDMGKRVQSNQSSRTSPVNSLD